ncbi:hypothetical protein BZM26_00330 [Paraburkholderia strydomiana]|nr:hypothetical protein BZM26_00330 [Paraburkholderia strydomiana]
MSVAEMTAMCAASAASAFGNERSASATLDDRERIPIAYRIHFVAAIFSWPFHNENWFGVDMNDSAHSTTNVRSNRDQPQSRHRRPERPLISEDVCWYLLGLLSAACSVAYLDVRTIELITDCLPVSLLRERDL